MFCGIMTIYKALSIYDSLWMINWVEDFMITWKAHFVHSVSIFKGERGNREVAAPWKWPDKGAKTVIEWTIFSLHYDVYLRGRIIVFDKRSTLRGSTTFYCIEKSRPNADLIVVVKRNMKSGWRTSGRLFPRRRADRAYAKRAAGTPRRTRYEVSPRRICPTESTRLQSAIVAVDCAFFSHRGRRIDAPNDWLEFDNARKYLKTPSRIEGRVEFASIRNLTARRSYVPRKGNEGENVGPPISHARLQDEIPKYSRVGVATRRRSKIRK